MAETAFKELEKEIAIANHELSSKTEEIKDLNNKIEDVDEIDSKSVFVGNVDYSTSTDELRDFF